MNPGDDGKHGDTGHGDGDGGDSGDGDIIGDAGESKGDNGDIVGDDGEHGDSWNGDGDGGDAGDGGDGDSVVEEAGAAPTGGVTSKIDGPTCFMLCNSVNV